MYKWVKIGPLTVHLTTWGKFRFRVWTNTKNRFVVLTVRNPESTKFYSFSNTKMKGC